MAILIRNATILAMGGPNGSTPFEGDLLIEGDRIAAIGPHLDAPEQAQVIDGRGRLVMPGLVNAHLHSCEALFKGRYDNLPLELWMLFSYPILGTRPLSERLIYLRTMLVAIESLKNGVTTLSDDLFEVPQQTLDQLGAAVQAYDDSGIRATVSGHVIDRNFLDTIPYARETVPQAIQDAVGQLQPPAAAEYIAFAKEAHKRFHGRSGRIRFMLAPSAPQRRHHPSGSTTRHASTALPGSTRWPTTSSPSPSSRQHVVKSGQSKVTSRTVGVFQMGGVRTPIMEDLDHPTPR